MTSPVEAERSRLSDLTQALAYAQSADAISEALEAFPDVAKAAIKALLEIGPVRSLLRMHPKTGASAPLQAMHRANLMHRAAYLVSAARRLSRPFRGPRLGMGDRLKATIETEKRYLAQHLDAVSNRVRAAEQVGQAMRVQSKRVARINETNGVPGRPSSSLLGWYAVMDERTSAECRRAHGRNFDPRQIPMIGFPGAVHPHCRCRPGPPHRTDARVEELPADITRAVTEAQQARQVVAASRVIRGGEWVVSGDIV